MSPRETSALEIHLDEFVSVMITASQNFPLKLSQISSVPRTQCEQENYLMKNILTQMWKILMFLAK